MTFLLTSSKESTSEITKPVIKIATATPKPTLPPIPSSYILPSGTHAFQSYNNCGPASLSMALSYYDIFVTQQVLGQELRPWQNSGGDNDDKSVTLSELAEKAKDFDLVPYHRPAGNPEIVKRFIANDIPVISRTNLDEKSDIGHFRVIVGYNDQTQSFLQDDSLQGNDLYYTYNNYNNLWKVFNYEFLVLIPQEKVSLAEIILGDLADEETSWRKSADISESELSKNPDDVNARFNLSVAYYHLRQYQKSIEEFEKVQNRLTFRTLWYQIEPILSYNEVGNYTKVFELTDNILNNHNRGFSELYALRGDIYEKQGNIQAAVTEYEKAVLYKQTEEDYKQKLDAIMAR